MYQCSRGVFSSLYGQNSEIFVSHRVLMSKVYQGSYRYAVEGKSERKNNVGVGVDVLWASGGIQGQNIM